MSQDSESPSLIKDKILFNTLKHISVEVHVLIFSDDESELEDDLPYLASVNASTVRSFLHEEAISVRGEP